MNSQTLEFKTISWWKSQWELVRNSQRVGTFSITKSMTYTEAVAAAGGKQWKFSYSSWNWSHKITVQDAAGEVIAETSQIGNWWKPRYQIELDGKKYIISSLSWSGMRYSVTDEHNRDVLTLQFSWLGKPATIKMQNSNIVEPTALLLAFVAFYQAKVIEAQSAAAASGTVVVASSS